MMPMNQTSAEMTAIGPQITPAQFNAQLLQQKQKCLGFLMDVASDPNDKRRVQASSIICRMPYLNEDGSDGKCNVIPTLLHVSVENTQEQTPIEPMFTTTESTMQIDELLEIGSTTYDADSEPAAAVLASEQSDQIAAGGAEQTSSDRPPAMQASDMSVLADQSDPCAGDTPMPALSAHPQQPELVAPAPPSDSTTGTPPNGTAPQATAAGAEPPGPAPN
ncbi:MAG: hypothetical protein HC837_15095, partial [Chloroflexaceae bacterium]|nr:hypothetical protein [Chloroflexaceae bacterium]